MNGAILLIPLFLTRYCLLSFLSKDALQKASFFTPMQGVEKTMFNIYQLSTLVILIYSFFTKIKTETNLFYIGLIIYLIGVILFILSTLSFAKPNENGINKRGLYNLSRNPMYVSYFVYFLGCSLLTQSIVLFISVVIFCISSHWIVLSEERYCVKYFGDEYVKYMQETRRYI